MFGRQPRLAVDVVLGLIDEAAEHQSYTSYIDKLHRGLKAAYELASRNTKQHNTGRKPIMILRHVLRS